MTADLFPLSLPDELQRYFWEYGTERPTMERSRHTVIRRLLEVGGWDAVTWLRNHVGDDELRRFILQRRGRGLSPKRLRFWELVLDLPGPRVDRWIAARRSDPWYRRTRA